MGSFCVNFHFRSTDDSAVSQALNRRGVTRYRVLPAKNGWTSLFEERASEQDDVRIRELGAGLSLDLHVPAVAFLLHDSDIACYWLFDNGQLLDEYNSDPGYFDDNMDSPPGPAGGKTDILLRYCPPGVQEEELAAILGEESVRETVFADDVIRRLAKALGISIQRALSDYRDVAGDDEPDELDGLDEDDDDGDPSAPRPRAELIQKLAKSFGFSSENASADPQVAALVAAAAQGDMDAIERLLAEGVDLQREALAPLPGAKPVLGLAQFFPGGIPQIALTPLFAAVVHKQRQAVLRLLDAGANPNHVHPQYGTTVHVATGAGDAETLQLLIEHGADVNARNTQGQTPLQMLAASRQGLEQLLQMQATMKSMGMKLPTQLANVSLPIEGWQACEQLLKARG